MKKIIALLLISTSAFAVEMSCEDYEQSVTLSQSWITCYTDTNKNVADLYVSPELSGERVVSNFSGRRLGSDAGTVAVGGKVQVIEISDERIQLKLNFKDYPAKAATVASLEVDKLENTNRFDHHSFEGRLKQKGNLSKKVVCTLNPPAYFEAPSIGCENVDVQSPSISGDLKRSCLKEYMLKSIYPNTTIKNRMRFKQDPVSHEVKCIVELNE